MKERSWSLMFLVLSDLAWTYDLRGLFVEIFLSRTHMNRHWNASWWKKTGPLELGPEGYQNYPKLPSFFVASCRCAGEYVPLSDRTANGYPIWEHTAGSRCWLYSGALKKTVVLELSEEPIWPILISSHLATQSIEGARTSPTFLPWFSYVSWFAEDMFHVLKIRIYDMLYGSQPGNNGMWIIGGNDAAAKNFACTRGVGSLK